MIRLSQGVVDMLEDRNVDRLKLRIAHRERCRSAETPAGGSACTPVAPASLSVPSGPARRPTRLAAVGLAVGVLFFALLGLIAVSQFLSEIGRG